MAAGPLALTIHPSGPITSRWWPCRRKPSRRRHPRCRPRKLDGVGRLVSRRPRRHRPRDV